MAGRIGPALPHRRAPAGRHRHLSLSRPGRKLFVKRVVGLPGETLQIESGRVYIDGQALDEPYVVYPSEESLSIQLEEDQYFIMGDNRAVSLDSRSIGPLSRDQLHGYVLGAVFPFDRFRWFA